MAARRTTFGKLQRDRAKQEKAKAKRERREERLAATADESPDAPAKTADVPQEAVIERLSALHERFDNGAIGFEEFETQKAALLASLAVD